MPRDNGKRATKESVGRKLKDIPELDSLVLKLLTEMTTEPENIDGERVQVVYHKHLLKKLESMSGGEPQIKLNQLIAYHYLVYNTKAPDPISYFIFASNTAGAKFAKKHPQAD